jgi:serine/threonine protein kinase
MFTVYTPGSFVNELNTDLSEREFTVANSRKPRGSTPVSLSDERGEGSAAQVWLAHFGDTRNEVAAKVVSKKGLNKDQIGWIREEIAIHKRLRHPYICTLHGSFKSLSNIMICLSLCRGGSLVDMMGAMLYAGELLAAAHVHGAFVQLLSALRYLESVGFVHTPRPQA